MSHRLTLIILQRLVINSCCICVTGGRGHFWHAHGRAYFFTMGFLAAIVGEYILHLKACT
jgi:hypothetical protein